MRQAHASRQAARGRWCVEVGTHCGTSTSCPVRLSILLMWPSLPLRAALGRGEAAGAPCMCPLTFALFIRLFLPAVPPSRCRLSVGEAVLPLSSNFVPRRAGLLPLLLLLLPGLPSALYTFINFTLNALPSLLPSPLSPQPQTTTSKARFQVVRSAQTWAVLLFVNSKCPPG